MLRQYLILRNSARNIYWRLIFGQELQRLYYVWSTIKNWQCEKNLEGNMSFKRLLKASMKSSCLLETFCQVESFLWVNVARRDTRMQIPLSCTNIRNSNTNFTIKSTSTTKSRVEWIWPVCGTNNKYLCTNSFGIQICNNTDKIIMVMLIFKWHHLHYSHIFGPKVENTEISGILPAQLDFTPLLVLSPPKKKVSTLDQEKSTTKICNTPSMMFSKLTIKTGQELGDNSTLHFTLCRFSFRSNRIDFINEQNTRCIFNSCVKQISNFLLRLSWYSSNNFRWANFNKW